MEALAKAINPKIDRRRMAKDLFGNFQTSGTRYPDKQAGETQVHDSKPISFLSDSNYSPYSELGKIYASAGKHVDTKTVYDAKTLQNLEIPSAPL